MVSELDIQTLVQTNPECLPIAEIDSLFINPVPICTELNTLAGPIDNFMVTTTGLPVLVECKLWRNPQARRELVAQILDYAKEITRWSASDLQREVSRRLKRAGNPLLELIQAADPTVDEVEFNDALTRNLRRGRFILHIVGDGIREGVEAIAEYLETHAGLHFSLGLIELPMFSLPDGGRLVIPRILARTLVVTRTIVAVPDGFVVAADTPDPEKLAETDPEQVALSDEQLAFWKSFLPYIKLDDPEQPMAKPARLGYVSFMLPAPNGSSWLNVYRDRTRGEMGLFLSCQRNTPGEAAMEAIAQDWETVRIELGGKATLTERNGRPRIFESRKVKSMTDPDSLMPVFEWLAERVNTYINVLRPRVRSIIADLANK
jgi:hypothetical protein